MTSTIQIIVFLLALLAAVAVLARRLRTAPSILLVAVGAAHALIPGLPAIQLAPEFVLLGLLPPIIYWARTISPDATRSFTSVWTDN
jgi:CPA1 family monovalent cation:H+ antiporter